MDDMREAAKALFWFTAYVVICAMVLLGLVALYINYGMLMLWLGVAIICALAFLNERKRRPIYIMPPQHPDDRRYVDIFPALSDRGDNDSRHLPDGRG